MPSAPSRQCMDVHPISMLGTLLLDFHAITRLKEAQHMPLKNPPPILLRCQPMAPSLLSATYNVSVELVNRFMSEQLTWNCSVICPCCLQGGANFGSGHHL